MITLNCWQGKVQQTKIQFQENEKSYAMIISVQKLTQMIKIKFSSIPKNKETQQEHTKQNTKKTGK